MQVVGKQSHLSKNKIVSIHTTPVVALVGNPNSGKTTLFNQLTGQKSKVGNYAGVTVDCKRGQFFTNHGKAVCLIDLPGAYSFSGESTDTQILINNLLPQESHKKAPDAVVCVVDAMQIERSLYFVSQVLELGIPAIVVVNMMDLAMKQGVVVDCEHLSKVFGVPVVRAQGNHPKGVIELKLALSQLSQLKVSKWRAGLGNDQLEKVYEGVKGELMGLDPELTEEKAHVEAMIALKYGPRPQYGEVFGEKVEAVKKELSEKSAYWLEDWVAHRYGRLSEIVGEAVRYTRIKGKLSLTDKVDNWFLHPFWGWVSLVVILGGFFYTLFALAEYPKVWIESLFMYLGNGVEALLPEGDLRNLLVEGVLGGVGSVLVFLPQIVILTMFIGLLEGSGYMARAAFLLDKVMSKVGLSGQAFIPFLTAHACAIPGILGTRILASKKERLAAILVLPFASCSARLPVYLLMIALMVPTGPYSALIKTGILFFAYGLGVVAALGFAYLFRKTFLKGENAFHLHEMPAYRVPAMRAIWSEMKGRCFAFVRDAGSIILGISIILWVGLTYPKVQEKGMSEGSKVENSFIGKIGQGLEPVFAPLGYDWKTNIAILSSFAAREVFVSTLAIVNNIEQSEEDLEDEIGSLSVALKKQKKEDGGVYYTPLVCLSLIVFYIFAMQCMSTLVVTYREVRSWKWVGFQFLYMTSFAYIAALLVYQIGRWLGYA